MKFAKDHISAVSSQQLRVRSLNAPEFVWIAQHKLARFERLFLRVCSRNAAPLNRGMTNAIPKPERFLFVWQGVTILSPDRLDAGHRLIRLACTIEGGCKSNLVRGNCNDHDV